MPEKPDITLDLITGREESAVVRILFGEYQAEIGIDLSFQDFASERASLRSYAPAPGAPLCCPCGGEPAGCIALRPREDNTCEMKRLFVRPPYRGLKLGRLLSERLIVDA